MINNYSTHRVSSAAEFKAEKSAEECFISFILTLLPSKEPKWLTFFLSLFHPHNNPVM